MSELTQETAKAIFDYDPDTGVLLWKISTNNRVHPGDVAGSVCGSGYMQVGINGKQYLSHRIAFLYVHGYLPKQVDHINGNRIDNRIANLRHADNSKNSMNKPAQSNNTSGFKGVSLHKSSGKYHARICASGLRRSIGYYKTAEQAFLAYSNAAMELHGDFAKTQ